LLVRALAHTLSCLGQNTTKDNVPLATCTSTPFKPTSTSYRLARCAHVVDQISSRSFASSSHGIRAALHPVVLDHAIDHGRRRESGHLLTAVEEVQTLAAPLSFRLRLQTHALVMP
jgi:hypothetical protein